MGNVSLSIFANDDIIDNEAPHINPISTHITSHHLLGGMDRQSGRSVDVPGCAGIHSLHELESPDPDGALVVSGQHPHSVRGHDLDDIAVLRRVHGNVAAAANLECVLQLDGAHSFGRRRLILFVISQFVVRRQHKPPLPPPSAHHIGAALNEPAIAHRFAKDERQQNADPLRGALSIVVAQNVRSFRSLELEEKETVAAVAATAAMRYIRDIAQIDGAQWFPIGLERGAVHKVEQLAAVHECKPTLFPFRVFALFP